MTVLRRVRRHLSQPRGDDGITLLESVIALLIASTVLLTMAAASMAGVKATLNARANQQVGDFMSQQLEKVRAMDYAALAMQSADLTGDSAITTCSGNPCYKGEQIVVNAAGSVSPHVATVPLTQANNITVTLSTYVTQPSDQFGASYKRVTVVAKWTTYGQTHMRVDSTLMTNTQRGLPLPVFSAVVVGNSANSVNPGATVTYAIKVSNQGARDRFNLTSGGSGTWAYYFDTNGNLSYNSCCDVAVTDTNSDGVLDTGMMEPNTSVTILAVQTIPSTATAGNQPTTFTFKSVAQPSAATGTQAVAVTTTIVIGTITGSPTPTPTPTSTSPTPTTPSSDCAAASVPTASAASGNSVYRYYLQTAGTNPMTMARSTSYTPSSGTASTTSLAPGASQAWTYTVANPRPTFAASSTAVVSLWVSTAGPSTNLAVNVQTLKSNGTLIASLGTVSLVASPVTCAGYQQMVGSFTLPSSTSSMPNSGQLSLTVTNAGASPVTVAYDASLVDPPSGRYQSYLDIGSNR